MSSLLRMLLVISVLGGICTPALANSCSLKAIVAESFAAWQSGTGSPFELLGEGMQWTVEGEGPLAGRYTMASFTEQVVKPFNARLASPLVPNQPILYQDGNTVIAMFEAQATLVSGLGYSNRYVWIMRFQDNNIVEVNAFLNLPAFERAMGVVR